MSENAAPPANPGWKKWLMKGHERSEEGIYQQPGEHPTHVWWQVMCLTGVDYFSTLGYQPGIAALAAGALAPIATLILVLLTLFGALPIYRRVSEESPHGEGSISMLEKLLSWWTGKLMVLCLLGFVATDFIITITLSAADATAHLVENPLFPESLSHHTVAITLFLVFSLGAIFLKGFKEAIGIAVVLVFIYLGLNIVVIGVGFMHVFQNPQVVSHWKDALFQAHGSPLAMIGVSLLLFPKLALGLSGFETGVAVMPMVKGKPGDSHEHPTGRIQNTRRLLIVAALIMSAFLLTSSFVTTVLIEPAEFAKGGRANGRALAFLAHEFLGSGFGTAYDLSTILILWFAGASAMAGLLNIVPRYLPRYGMAPDWTRATRPLVLVYVAIAFLVTALFRADVDAQGGAYATGVLVLMSSGSLAVTISAFKKGRKTAGFAFGLITLVFFYTTIVNVIERTDGIKIASFFILAIVVTSLFSRISRTTELRAEKITFDDEAKRFLAEAECSTLRILANDPERMDAAEYRDKEAEERERNLLPLSDPVLFLEVNILDPSEFSGNLMVRGAEVDGYHVLRVEASAVPNAIAAILLKIRDMTGIVPHIYMDWSENRPLVNAIRYLISGEGDIAPVTHEILRHVEKDVARRPTVHVG